MRRILLWSEATNPEGENQSMVKFWVYHGLSRLSPLVKGFLWKSVRRAPMHGYYHRAEQLPMNERY